MRVMAIPKLLRFTKTQKGEYRKFNACDNLVDLKIAINLNSKHCRIIL